MMYLPAHRWLAIFWFATAFNAAPVLTGNEILSTLVLDCSPSSGKVVLVRPDDGKWSSSVLVERVDMFVATPSGHYICRTHNGGQWRRGRVGSKAAPEPVLNTVLNAVGEGLQLSPDGQRVVFISREGDADKLIMAKLDDGTRTVVVEKRGFARLLAPAWSPDGRSLAYYAREADGVEFDPALVVQNVLPEVDKPKEVAPPSLPTRLGGPSRDQPQWSPDGKRILFEARYGKNFRDKWHVVNADGSQRQPAVAGTWSSNRPRLLTVQRSEGSGQALQYSLGVADFTDDGLKVQSLPIDISPANWILVWEPLGRYVVTISDDNVIWIIHVDTGKRERVGPLEGRCTWAAWVDNRDPGKREP